MEYFNSHAHVRSPLNSQIEVSDLMLLYSSYYIYYIENIYNIIEHPIVLTELSPTTPLNAKMHALHTKQPISIGNEGGVCVLQTIRFNTVFHVQHYLYTLTSFAK